MVETIAECLISISIELFSVLGFGVVEGVLIGFVIGGGFFSILLFFKLFCEPPLVPVPGWFVLP